MTRAAALLVAILSACSSQVDAPPVPRPPPAAPRLVHSLPLPPGAGIHIVEIPQPDTIESVRCIVAVSETGSVSAACPTKGLDLASPDP